MHGASHMGGEASYPASVSAMAKYVAANGVVVKATTLHPMYNHITKENDIAIYFLNKTVFSAEPVTLSSKQGEFFFLGYYLGFFFGGYHLGFFFEDII